MTPDELHQLIRACQLAQLLFLAFRELTLFHPLPPTHFQPNWALTTMQMEFARHAVFFGGFLERVYDIPDSHRPRDQQRLDTMLMGGGCDTAMAIVDGLIRQLLFLGEPRLADDAWEVRVWFGSAWHWLYMIRVEDHFFAFDITGPQHHNRMALRLWDNYIATFNPTLVDPPFPLGHVRGQHRQWAWAAQNNNRQGDFFRCRMSRFRLVQFLQGHDLDDAITAYLDEHRLTLRRLVRLPTAQYQQHTRELLASVRRHLASHRRHISGNTYQYETRSRRVE
ncbi:hypothetical protein BDV96DRAFT_662265 [Lophiotrema nucula]|uniref:Uncharacterized protein n=1 Tax=Lophiotrema nucula TaxID=690887 RepID=A0A6A5Z1A1_9PLEO|nr:hypothetical protein BDV96DRAFT_662265 [Lophiotrema nucula]